MDDYELSRLPFKSEIDSLGQEVLVKHDGRLLASTTLDHIGDVVSRALDTHNNLVRQALIEMGWTPPPPKTGSTNGS